MCCTHYHIRKDEFDRMVVRLSVWRTDTWRFHLRGSAVGCVSDSCVGWTIAPIEVSMLGNKSKHRSVQEGSWVCSPICNEALVGYN